jgi:hypothetical protein
MQKLEPCPFKGCQVSIEIERPGLPHPDVNLYVIEDRVCGFRFVNHDRGKLEETWNSRPRADRLEDFLRKIAGGPELPLSREVRTSLQIATFTASWSQEMARRALKHSEEKEASRAPHPG